MGVLTVPLKAATRVPFRLIYTATGLPKTDAAFGDITCYIQKQATPPAAFAVLVGKFFVNDQAKLPGDYDLLFAAADLDTLGYFKYYVSCAACITYPGIVQVSATEQLLNNRLDLSLIHI